MIQEITKSKEGKFNTTSLKLIDLYNPTVDMIDLDDILIALLNICRFGGHLSEFYSVFQHSLLVWKLSEVDNSSVEVQKVALFHDAAEAYLGDVISPLKHILVPLYDPLEKNFLRVIFEKFNLDYSLLPQIKKYDIEALVLENDHYKHDKQHDVFYKLMVSIYSNNGQSYTDHKELFKSIHTNLCKTN